MSISFPSFLSGLLLGWLWAINPLSAEAQLNELGAEAPVNLKVVEFDHAFLEAQRMKVTGNLTGARDLLLKCLMLNPQSDAAHFEMANMHVALDDLNAGLVFALKAKELNPGNVWYRYLIGRLYYRMGNLRQTIREFEAILDEFEVSPETRLELAGYCMQAGAWKKALKVYNQMEKDFGLSEEISLARERIYLSQGKTGKALSEIEKLVAAYPRESRFYGMLAESHSELGNWEKARQAYEQVFALDPDNGLARISYAAFLQRLGRPDLGFEQLKLGFSDPAVPPEVKAEFFNPQTIGKPGEVNEELVYQLLNILVETHPENVLVHGLKADFLINNHRTEDAAGELQFILTLDKRNYFVWEKLLLLTSELEDVARVFELSSEAIELFPNQPMMFLFHGSSAFQLRKFDLAIRSLEMGLDLAGENSGMKVEFLRYLGESWYRKGDYGKSDALFEQLIQLDSAAIDVMNNYAYYLSLRGKNLDRALELAGKAMVGEPDNSSYIDTYAWVLFKRAEYQEAARVLERALKANGNRNAVILEHYGDVQFKLGNTSTALEFWYRAREAGQASDLLDRKIRDKSYIE